MYAIRSYYAIALLGLGIDSAIAQPVEPAPTESLTWQQVATLPRGGGASALVVDAASGEIAVGDASGVRNNFV